MGRAWESMDMAMKDQDDGLAARISQHPGAAVSVSQFDRRGRLPDPCLFAHINHRGWSPTVWVRYSMIVCWLGGYGEVGPRQPTMKSAISVMEARASGSSR